jgi:hypothetical protein
MSAENLEEALKDESGQALYEYWIRLSSDHQTTYRQMRLDIVALIEKSRESKSDNNHDFNARVDERIDRYMNDVFARVKTLLTVE